MAYFEATGRTSAYPEIYKDSVQADFYNNFFSQYYGGSLLKDNYYHLLFNYNSTGYKKVGYCERLECPTFPSNYVITNLVVTIEYKTYYSTTASDKYIILSAASNQYNKTTSGDMVATWLADFESSIAQAQIAPNSEGTFAVNTTDDTLAKKMLTNGINIACTELDSYSDYIRFGFKKVEITYSYPTEPATIVLTYPTEAAIILNDAEQTVTWDYAHLLNYAQSHYDLQVSYNEGASWTTLADKVASTAHQHILAADTLNTGNVILRARAYHTNGTIVSDWSVINIKIKGTPLSSLITCDTKPRTTITWTASNVQQAIQIVVTDIFDSGTIFTALGSYTLPLYLADGIHEIKFRYADTSGAWSDWSLAYPIIGNVSSGTITLSGRSEDNFVKLSWESTGTFSSFYVIRDGECIVKATTGGYTDKLICGTHTYKIRGTHGNNYYSDSAEISITNIINRTLLRTLDADVALPLTRVLGAAESKQFDYSSDTAFEFYSGRKYPVAITGDNISRSASYKYVFRTAAERAILQSLIGKTVIALDCKGTRQIGVITAVTEIVTAKFCEVAIKITDVDYPEKVDYDD